MPLLECPATQLHSSHRLSGLRKQMIAMIAMIAMTAIALEHRALRGRPVKERSETKGNHFIYSFLSLPPLLPVSFYLALPFLS